MFGQLFRLRLLPFFAAPILLCSCEKGASESSSGEDQGRQLAPAGVTVKVDLDHTEKDRVEPVEVSLKLHNKYKTAVEITDVHLSCSCILLDRKIPLEIQAGEFENIKFSIDVGSRRGVFDESVIMEVRVNGQRLIEKTVVRVVAIEKGVYFPEILTAVQSNRNDETFVVRAKVFGNRETYRKGVEATIDDAGFSVVKVGKMVSLSGTDFFSQQIEVLCAPDSTTNRGQVKIKYTGSNRFLGESLLVWSRPEEVFVSPSRVLCIVGERSSTRCSRVIRVYSKVEYNLDYDEDIFEVTKFEKDTFQVVLRGMLEGREKASVFIVDDKTGGILECIEWSVLSR